MKKPKRKSYPVIDHAERARKQEEERERKFQTEQALSFYSNLGPMPDRLRPFADAYDKLKRGQRFFRNYRAYRVRTHK